MITNQVRQHDGPPSDGVPSAVHAYGEINRRVADPVEYRIGYAMCRISPSCFGRWRASTFALPWR